MVKVIIAEDNVPISVHLSNVINFTKEVSAIAIVNNGAEVYQTLKKMKPDILVLDLKLPGEDGIEILKKIEQDVELKKIQVVVYSGEHSYIRQLIGFSCIADMLDKAHDCEEVGIAVQKIAKGMLDEERNQLIKDTLIKLGFRPEHIRNNVYF